MNRHINNAMLIAVAAAGIHANAMSTLSRSFKPVEACRTHAVRDDEGARLRNQTGGLGAKGDRPSPTLVFLNASALTNSKAVPRACNAWSTTSATGYWSLM